MSSMLIFLKEKCIAELRARGLPEARIEGSLSWMGECDGKEVTLINEDRGDVVGTPFGALISWCEEVSVSE